MLHRLRFNRSHGNAKLQRIPRSASRPRRLRRSRRIPRGGRSGFARWSRSRSCSRRSCFSLAHRVRRCIRRRHMPAAGRFTPELRQERAANAAQRARKPASRSSRARMPQDEKPQANQCTGAVSRATGNCRRPHHMFDHQFPIDLQASIHAGYVPAVFGRGPICGPISSRCFHARRQGSQRRSNRVASSTNRLRNLSFGAARLAWSRQTRAWGRLLGVE